LDPDFSLNDVKDADWIAQRLQKELIGGSFVPAGHSKVQRNMYSFGNR
jgi:hypothetical protein